MITLNPSVKKNVNFKKIDPKAKKPKAKPADAKKANGVGSRAAIKMYSGEHSTIADEVERVLIARDVQFFQRSGELVRPVSVKLPAAHGAKTTAIHLREVNPVFARDMMSRHIDFVRYDARSAEWKPVVAPLPIAATIIERKAEWKFRNVIGVISTPTMRPDGSLLIVEGHDATTDLLLINPPDMPTIPGKPTRADAMAALGRLK